MGVTIKLNLTGKVVRQAISNVKRETCRFDFCLRCVIILNRRIP